MGHCVALCWHCVTRCCIFFCFTVLHCVLHRVARWYIFLVTELHGVFLGSLWDTVFPLSYTVSFIFGSLCSTVFSLCYTVVFLGHQVTL